MKLTMSLFIFIFFQFTVVAQNKSPHYVLPEFTEGIVLMKDGTKQTEMLNYNALSNNFALKKDDKILAVSKTVISKIDTVYVANRKFFRKDDKFLELLLKSEVKIYLEHRCNLLSSTEGSSGYGGTSQTTSSTKLSSTENRGNLYDLELSELYKVKSFKRYWINKDNVINKVKTLGQIKKLYKERKKEIKTYRKTHNVDINIPLSIVKLVQYLEGE